MHQQFSCMPRLRLQEDVMVMANKSIISSEAMLTWTCQQIETDHRMVARTSVFEAGIEQAQQLS